MTSPQWSGDWGGRDANKLEGGRREDTRLKAGKPVNRLLQWGRPEGLMGCMEGVSLDGERLTQRLAGASGWLQLQHRS